MSDEQEPNANVIYCSNCGQQLHGDANFCDRCGAETSQQTPAGQSAGASAPTASPTPDASSGAEGAPQSNDSDSGVLSTAVPKNSTRRRVLQAAGGGLALLVGGSFVLGFLGGSTHELAGDDAWSNVDEATTLQSQSLSGTVRLGEGEFVGRFLNPSRSINVEMEVEVTQGGPVDLWTMERSEFTRFQEKNENTVFLTGLSEERIRNDQVSGTLSAGDYVVVIDNTGWAGADPSGEAVADVVLRGSV